MKILIQFDLGHKQTSKLTRPSKLNLWITIRLQPVPTSAANLLPVNQLVSVHEVNVTQHMLLELLNNRLPLLE